MRIEKPTKHRFLDQTAEESGVAITILDKNGNEVSVSNNNSVCRMLWDDPEYGDLCRQDCGKAFDLVSREGRSVEFECHAGLFCRAVMVSDRGTEFVAVIGRLFLKGQNYRNASEKAISGEWSRFRPTEFFENVLMSGSDSGIYSAIERLGRFIVKHESDLLDLSSKPETEIKDEISRRVEEFSTRSEQVHGPVKPQTNDQSRIGPEASRLRSLLGSLTKLEYSEACKAILQFLADIYEFDSLVWLERRGDALVATTSFGRLEEKTVRISIPVENERLEAAIKAKRCVKLRQRNDFRSPGSPTRLSLFPVTVGSEIRGAFAVAGNKINGEVENELVRFAKGIGPQLEILRLRDEVSRRDWVAKGVKRFVESLKQIDKDDFLTHVMQISAELLQAQRASLLLRGEKSDDLYATASIGAATDLKSLGSVGSRIAVHALEQGDPVVVSDIRKEGIALAPSEWRYRSNSFISFPILIGDRRLAVMNFTDRAGGDSFGERDLELLQTIAPQIAVAIDRTTLKDRAGEFEQLSVTDPLTGLLNRRYLDERLQEEMNRARRHRAPITLMMIDVDHFKSYNDSFGHAAGDLALKMLAGAMKDTLRADDVAARFGGEEFAILLPRTSPDEAATIAERIRSRIEHTHFPYRRVTISLGLAGYSTEFESPKDWIDAADLALYEAKELGRNGVQIYELLGKSFRDKIN